MPRPLTGTVEVDVLGDGTRAFRLRFSANGRRERLVLHERAGCECGCGGGWDERGARRELGDILARVRAGVWTPARRPPAAPAASVSIPTFHEYASRWL